MRRRPAIMWSLLALLFLGYVAAAIINIKDNQTKVEKQPINNGDPPMSKRATREITLKRA